MIVGHLETGDKFYYKNCSYRVIDVDFTFVKAEKVKNDGFKHYFLKDIKVDRLFFYSELKGVNPNHDINDRYGRK